MYAENKPVLEPFRGTVTVKFSDAIIASTREALVLKEEGREPVFYIPQRDVYFEFMRPSETNEERPSLGRARFWSVWGVGESAEDAVKAYEQPAPEFDILRTHATFDPAKVRIETAPEEDRVHTPHLP